MKRQADKAAGAAASPRAGNRARARRPLSGEDVRGRLRGFLGRFGIRRIVLFGSFARGTQTWDSDVDLIVITRDRRRFLDRYRDVLPALFHALKPHAVEPLIYTEREFRALLDRGAGVVVAAMKEGVVLDVQSPGRRSRAGIHPPSAAGTVPEEAEH